MGKKKELLINGDNDVEQQHQKKRKSKKCDGKSRCIIILTLMLLLSIGIIAYLLLPTTQQESISNVPKHYVDHGSEPNGKFGNLIFDDEFDTLNLTTWQHVITLSGGGNWEFEYYQNNRSNSYVRDGILYLKPTLTNNTFTDPSFMTSGTISLWGSDATDSCTDNSFYGCEREASAANAINSVQSARIRTANSFSFKYGRIEVRAQLPEGDWLWPAVWLLPVDNAYAMWPASGEIDIIESRGNDHLTSAGKDIGVTTMGTTLNWGPYWPIDMEELTHDEYSLPGGKYFSAGFHNWTMDWTPDGFNCSCDGNLYFTVDTNKGYWDKGGFDTNQPGSFNPWQNGGKDAPFDREFFFVMNVAAGGVNGYFPTGSQSAPDGFPAYAQPWSDSSQTALGQFWQASDKWYPTWKPFENNGESAAMKVDYLRVYEYTG